MQLKQPDGNLGKVALDVFLGGDWTVFTPKPEPVLIPDVLQYAPSKHPDFQKQQMQAIMMLDMFDLQAQHEANSMLARLHMHLKPQKKVVAVGKIAKQKLTLGPMQLALEVWGQGARRLL